MFAGLRFTETNSTFLNIIRQMMSSDMIGLNHRRCQPTAAEFRSTNVALIDSRADQAGVTACTMTRALPPAPHTSLFGVYQARVIAGCWSLGKSGHGPNLEFTCIA